MLSSVPDRVPAVSFLFCKAANWIIRGALYTPISRLGRREEGSLDRIQEKRRIKPGGARQTAAKGQRVQGEGTIHYSPQVFK